MRKKQKKHYECDASLNGFWLLKVPLLSSFYTFYKIDQLENQSSVNLTT